MWDDGVHHGPVAFADIQQSFQSHHPVGEVRGDSKPGVFVSQFLLGLFKTN